jgi:hypothetical protein
MRRAVKSPRGVQFDSRIIAHSFTRSVGYRSITWTAHRGHRQRATTNTGEVHPGPRVPVGAGMTMQYYRRNFMCTCTCTGFSRVSISGISDSVYQSRGYQSVRRRERKCKDISILIDLGRSEHSRHAAGVVRCETTGTCGRMHRAGLFLNGSPICGQLRFRSCMTMGKLLWVSTLSTSQPVTSTQIGALANDRLQ